MTPAQSTLTSYLGALFFGEKRIPAPGVLNKDVLEEATKQSVDGLLIRGYGPAAFGELSEVATKYLYTALQKNARVHAAHTALHRLLTEAGVPYVILKGAASASYYPVPSARSMGDVDFWVSPENHARALSVLEENGFCLHEDRPGAMHAVLSRDGVWFEMHRQVTVLPDTPVCRQVFSLFDDLESTSVLLSSSLTECRVPDDFHHGLLMLLHIRRHLYVSGIGLRHVLDFAVFLCSLGEERFVELFRDKLRAVGLWTLARTLALLSHRAFGLPYASYMGDDGDLADTLLEDVLSGGEFGRKDTLRGSSGAFIVGNSDGDEKKAGFFQVFSALDAAACARFPWVKKCPLLRPAGWGLCILRRTVLTLFGRRRRFRALRAYRASKPRVKLYRRLAVFDPDARTND